MKVGAALANTSVRYRAHELVDILLSRDQKRLLRKYGMDRRRMESLREAMRQGRWAIYRPTSEGL